MLASSLVTGAITSTSGTSASVRSVLLVGPDDDARRSLHMMLDRFGKQVSAVAELEVARSYLGNGHECDAVIVAGELAAELVRGGGMPPVIAVVRPRDPVLAMALLEAGVDHVVSDPLDELALALALRHVANLPRRTAIVAPPPLVGDGEVMQRLRGTIERVAATRSTVLILGESGTGKELVARAIHDASPRRGRRFVAVNCAAIPAALLESELFGHRRGAFTDAVRDKSGLFEDADGGTLFLDEIGELPLALQAKLLRVLQDGEIRRVGDTASLRVDVRLIAATLRDLADDVREGRFREDLYYRLNVLPVAIPPLRERTEDIPALARFFAQRHSARHQLGEVELSDVAIEALARQPWPGNVRELENVIERAVVLADVPTRGRDARVIDIDYLGTVMNVQAPPPAAGAGGLSIKKATREIEQDLIRRALGATQGNRTNAAKLLEISHRALLYKMKEYGIT
jgi:two-component system response regulator AtoC